MSKEEKCLACEKDKALWITGIIGTAVFTLIVLFVFEIINLETSLKWIKFIIWYGVGFAVTGISIIIGIAILKMYCETKDAPKITNWDKGLRLGLMLVAFSIATIILSLIAFNMDNSYWETIYEFGSVKCSDVPDDFKFYCTEDSEEDKLVIPTSSRDSYYQNFDCNYDGHCSIEKYILNDLQFSGYIQDSASYVQPQLDKMFSVNDCSGLIQWRLTNYAQGARHYAGHLIDDLDCLDSGIWDKTLKNRFIDSCNYNNGKYNEGTEICVLENDFRIYYENWSIESDYWIWDDLK